MAKARSPTFSSAIEVVDRAGPQQPGVVEALNQRQDDLSVDVVLQMFARLIADADRLHAAIARDGGDDPLVDVLLQPDAIDRLDVAARRLVDEVPQIDEVVLEDVHRAQTVQRPHRVIGVADPAVAVVPVAAALGELGHRGGHGRDDGPRLLEGAELQRDGRADDRVLIVQRNVEGADPVLPVGHGAVQRRRDPGPDLLVIALVRPEEEGQRVFQPEGALVENMGHRAVGGQPQGHIRAQIADVVRAVGGLGPARAPVGRGP
jgi:hypothetical protein